MPSTANDGRLAVADSPSSGPLYFAECTVGGVLPLCRLMAKEMEEADGRAGERTVAFPGDRRCDDKPSVSALTHVRRRVASRRDGKRGRVLTIPTVLNVVPPLRSGVRTVSVYQLPKIPAVTDSVLVCGIGTSVGVNPRPAPPVLYNAQRKR